MRVHITDDHDLILQGFKVLLEAYGITVVGTSLNGAQLINWLQTNKCDVLILDISMPDVNGIEVLKVLKDKNILPKTIIVSADATDAVIYDSIKNGAKGYILKDEASNDIIEALNEVYNNNTYYSNAVKEIILTNNLETDFNYVYKQVLSDRERQVYDCMLNELSPSEIENKLLVSESTIRTHLQRVRQKFNVKSNISLALIALKYIKK